MVRKNYDNKAQVWGTISQTAIYAECTAHNLKNLIIVSKLKYDWSKKNFNWLCVLVPYSYRTRTVLVPYSYRTRTVAYNESFIQWLRNYWILVVDATRDKTFWLMCDLII